MKINSASLALLGLTLFATPAVASEGWIADFDEAVKIAKEQKKDLFVDFTGSDWCGYCIKLDKSVFAFDSFTDAVTKDFVLVALDFPRKEPAMSRVPNATRNKELARKYGVTGYPTVLLMSADGEVYGKTGYRKGGPEAYVEHIKGLRATGRKELVKSQKTVAAYNSAKGKAKAKALENLLSVLSELPKGSPFSAKLVEPAMSALTLDPKNEKGLLLKAVRALSLAGIHEAELLGAATKFDASNKEGVLELAVMAMFESVTDADSASAAVKELDTVNTYDFQDKKTGFMMNFTAATWSAGPLNNPDAVKGYVARAKKTGHEDAKLMERLDELSKGN